MLSNKVKTKKNPVVLIIGVLVIILAIGLYQYHTQKQEEAATKSHEQISEAPTKSHEQISDDLHKFNMLRAKMEAEERFERFEKHLNAEASEHYSTVTVLLDNAKAMDESVEKTKFSKLVKESMSDDILTNKEFSNVQESYIKLKEREDARILIESLKTDS